MRYAKRFAATLLVFFSATCCAFVQHSGWPRQTVTPGGRWFGRPRVAAEGLRSAGSLLGTLASPF